MMRVLFLSSLLFVLVIPGAGCGDPDCPADTEYVGGRCVATDAGSGDGATPGDGGVDCGGAADGTPCGSGQICVGGDCSPSRCGDGYVDVERGEQCEDGNEEGADGCQPVTCRYSCESPEDCDDGSACNGAETCDTTTHTCQRGTDAPAGTECARPEGGAGVCRRGLCVSPGCGNSVVDDGEDCDDGMNGDDADGCRDDCSFTCTARSDCDDGDACNGTETCDTGTHQCVPGTDLDCDDSNGCTADRCDASAGCVNELIDGDGDGYAAGTCPAGTMGGDCDDADNTAYPGAPELCDEIDNDCDGPVDEDVSTVTCFRDADGDGYPHPSTDLAMEACACPAGYVPERSDGLFDCHDWDDDVHPGQTLYFAVASMPLIIGGIGTFDYDCNGTPEKRWTERAASCSSAGVAFCDGGGWTGADIPSCGATAQFQVCSRGCFGCVCSASIESRTQECR